jgi:predicted XRE-type DNA-binding protein
LLYNSKTGDFYLANKRRKKMAETKVLKKTHPLSELDARMDPAVLEKARKMAQEESLNIRLGMLREKYGMKQSEVVNFTQTAVSKLENRKDIRISTLIDYLASLGMGLEIVAYPRNSTEKEILLRV